MWCTKEDATYLRKLRNYEKNRMLIMRFLCSDKLAKRKY